VPNADKFKTLTCLEGKSGQDPLLDEIQRDVESSSVLQAMMGYINQLEGKLDNNARPYQKLARLFMAGFTPGRVEGHHDGEAIGLRTGDEQGLLASYGNFLGYVWGTVVGPVAPWVGKSFSPVDATTLRNYTDGFEKGETPTYLGINHFEEMKQSVAMLLGYPILVFWMGLKDAPQQEHELYGYEKNGGLFIARQAASVYPGTVRQVFQLNYRWHNLGNLPPVSYLIDEIVTIGDGVYLGQLLFATKGVLHRYDPGVPAAECDYQHFGYFLLMDDSWAGETRRVFKNIKPGLITSQVPAPPPPPSSVVASTGALSPKFTTLTFAKPVEGACDDTVLAQIQQDMKGHETILDVLKTYSDELMRNYDNRSPSFLKLHELFNRAIGPDEVTGFLHGALVTFHTEGFYRFFNLNTLNVGWMLGRLFTPWTGKTFEPITPDRLKDYTGGAEVGSVPTFWGTNTLSFKTARQRFIKDVMKVAGVWTEDVPPEESNRYRYDLKSFFFIARKGVSINEENKGKKVFLFNYRWPKLRTSPPDNFCIDELVKIADGLYLGQLIYATELLQPYDSNKDPSAYKYRLFGYFLLMDDDWQKRRLSIGLDPYNV
jgi:hypothetical protein